ncbi:MAG TPA: hypothetical protein VK515_04970 [Rhizomicrobium sp.]|nr:hypothetical protein [Rhizomicrobium sp.]
MRFVLTIILILGALPAAAATPSSWKALHASARAGCEREITRLASKAKISTVTGKISGIGAANDTDRYYALILGGKTAGFASQWLCLYDKRTKQATAQEVEKP